MITWKEAYKQFASKNILPLFFQEWYLDALVGDGNWACNFVYEAEKVNAIWLYFPKKKWGIPYCVIPTMVKYLGPLFDKQVEKANRLELAQQLFREIPPHYSFSQQYIPSFSTTFCKQITDGFSFRKQITFRERNTFYWDISIGLDDILRQMDGNYRRAIKKYESLLELRGFRPNEEETIIKEFIELLESSMGSLEKHGLTSTGLKKFIVETEKRGAGKLLLLTQNEELICGSFIAWDDDKAYYLLAGNNSKEKKIYPGIQMAFHSAKYLMKNTSVKCIDFVGSDIESIARIWRKLGAERKTYSAYTEKSWWFFK